MRRLNEATVMITPPGSLGFIAMFAPTYVRLTGPSAEMQGPGLALRNPIFLVFFFVKESP